MYVLVAGLPGLAHRLEQGRVPLQALQALLDAVPGGVFEGNRVVGRGSVDQALALAATRSDDLGVAVALAGPPTAELDGHPVGGPSQQARMAVAFVREGEVLVTPAVVDVPEGVGAFDAPAVLSEQVGVPLRFLKDYR